MKEGTIYTLDGRVPLKTAIPLGIQHVLAMFISNISPILIVCGMLGTDAATKAMLVQNAMFIAGIVTLIQLYPIAKRIGAGLPIVMGTSSGFLGTAKAIGASYGYGAILGASLTGALIEVVLSFFIKPLRKLCPSVVSGVVVMCIGLSLIPVGINFFAGGVGASDFGSPSNLLLGLIVLVTIIFFKEFTKGFWSVSAILIGIIVGYITAIFMNKIDFSAVQSAAWFSLPKPYITGIEFRWEAIIPFAIMYIATAVETIGDTSAITMGGLNREVTDKELAGAVMADGVGSFFAALFGVLPNTSFSQNVGLISINKVVNRFVIMTGAVFLLLAGFFPKLGALVSAMPSSVLGGAAVMMFAMITVSGMQLVFKNGLTPREGTIVAISLGLGIGLGNVPSALEQLPEFISMIFAQNGIIVTFLVAVFLNIILPNKPAQN